MFPAESWKSKNAVCDGCTIFTQFGGRQVIPGETSPEIRSRLLQKTAVNQLSKNLLIITKICGT